MIEWRDVDSPEAMSDYVRRFEELSEREKEYISSEMRVFLSDYHAKARERADMTRQAAKELSFKSARPKRRRRV